MRSECLNEKADTSLLDKIVETFEKQRIYETAL